MIVSPAVNVPAADEMLKVCVVLNVVVCSNHHHRAALWSTGWAWFIYCRARLTKLDSEESKPTRSKTKVSA